VPLPRASPGSTSSRAQIDGTRYGEGGPKGEISRTLTEEC